MTHAPVLRVWDIDAPHLPNAACRDMDPALFAGPEDGATREQVLQAKHVCARCVERVECLAYALARPGDYYRDPDIWGGTTHHERREMRQQTANAERRARRRAKKEATP